LLSAIEELEAAHDAKCYSSASRFEDFLFGTPLEARARHAHTELQKRFAERVWRRAAERSTAAGVDAVRSLDIAAVRGALFSLEASSAGDLRIEFRGVPALEVPGVRATQYASVAYSLRAILSLQQDQLMADLAPPRLAPEAIEELTRTLDAAALAALSLADRAARERSEPEVSELAIRAAWDSLLPGFAQADGAGRIAAAPTPGVARAHALALLEELVAGKLAAYQVYNELAPDPIPLLVFNIARFYARAPLSTLRSQRRSFVAALREHLYAFAAALLSDAGGRAALAGSALIRALEAEAGAQHFLPQRIDSFEDVHLFEHLDGEARTTLASFDCDSFRDFGLHWEALLRAARSASEELPLPDPFAAEILAESVSQYGVLSLRLAGERVARDPTRATLEIADLDAAAGEILERARRQRVAPAPGPRVTHIASAPGEGSGSAPGAFTDATREAGVQFVHRSSRWLGEFRHKQLKTPPTFSGGGVAAEDFDGDGHVDLFFAGGGGNSLLRNTGQGRFEDTTAAAGLGYRRSDGESGEARNAIFADFDNDGHQDLLVTYVDDDHRLYRNVGRGRFEDVSASAGLGGRGLVGGPATVFDFDGDGLLDVYIAYFGDYLNGAIPTFDRNNRNALHNRLYRNRGGMRFEDVSEGSGTSDPGWTQAVSHVDFDRDGRQDLVVANDYGRNAFLRNLGAGHFEDVTLDLGIDRAFHSMNVGVADLNDDDHPDIYISNIATLVKDEKYRFPDVDTPLDFDLRAMAGMLVKESDILYLSQVEEGRLRGYVASNEVERGATSTGWAWDAEFFDFDHDGDEDLYLVNGTNDFNVFSMLYRRRYDDGTSAEFLLDHARESNVLFQNEGGRLRNVSPGSGADQAENSRSTAYLDFDGDGDLDVAVNNFHAPARLLRNDAEKPGRGWLMLDLVGDPERGSNRDAIGARLVATTADGRRLRRYVQGGSGYLSMNPKRQHLGLGSSASADVTILWPNGESQQLQGLVKDTIYRVEQGKAPRALPQGASTR
jgi:hypothetical protein